MKRLVGRRAATIGSVIYDRASLPEGIKPGLFDRNSTHVVARLRVTASRFNRLCMSSVRLSISSYKNHTRAVDTDSP